ncbi:MAG: 5'/3'-nucleotidase SurE [Promethearchaeota archaeon]
MTNSKRPHIFITNDDSVRSPALPPFIRELKSNYELTIVVPEIPQSGISKALSFNVPLRFHEGQSIENHVIIETSGTPADAVTWCRTFFPDIDLVIAGPNLGLNVSSHSIYTSGTVGAIFEAALWDIPSIAFSIDTPSHTWFVPSDSGANFTEAAKRSRQIIDHVVSNGLPTEVDLLNVSLPHNVNSETPIKIANTIRTRFDNRVESRTDPHGVKYYWIAGEEMQPLPKTSDVYLVTKESQIVICPISIAVSNDELIEKTTRLFQTLIE